MPGFCVNDDEIKQVMQSLEEYGSRKNGERGELDYNTTLIALCVLGAYLEYRSEIDDLHKWHRLASSYGINVETMLTLAKSQIKTSASNIELFEDVNKILNLFTNLPKELPNGEIEAALVVYDGDRSKPYCDLVYLGLCIIRGFYKLHDVVSKYKFDDVEK